MTMISLSPIERSPRMGGRIAPEGESDAATGLAVAFIAIAAILALLLIAGILWL